MRHSLKSVFVFVFLILNLEKSIGIKSDWWKYTTIYEVFIWSFKDSNGDGIGDIKGVASMLDHFDDLGIETLWISPFFESPGKDMGYDISDFTNVDPTFGTLQDFDELMKEMKKRGMKLIIDCILNHSSDEHPWFLKSVDRVEPYSGYYVWKNPKGFDSLGNPIPPNNWRSLVAGSAWKWNEKRQQFYLHQFSDKQPDFDLRNPLVKEELKNMITFWFKKGVSGLRLDAAAHYFEDELLRDEVLKDESKHKIKFTYFDYVHNYTTDLPETYEFIRELRKFTDHFKSDEDQEEEQRILVAEIYTTLKNSMMYYGTKMYPICHLPFNFKLTTIKSFENAKSFDENYVKYWLDNMPPGGVANWVNENHDVGRMANRLNEEYADILLITLMTLPGVACVYYGQEIGMIENVVRPDQRVDKFGHELRPSRDSARLPMQWDDTNNAGFTSSSKPWLPVHSNYWTVNVQQQKRLNGSRYNMFKTLSNLRKTDAAKFGNFKSYVISFWVYAFTRSLQGKPIYITMLNLGTETERINLLHVIPNLSEVLIVVSASMNAGFKRGDEVLSNPKFPQTFNMRPLSAIVLSTKRDTIIFG